MVVSKPSGDDGDDESFAEVLNNLTGGPWFSTPRVKKPAKSLATRQPTPVQEPLTPRSVPSAHAGSEEWSEPAASASVVRPYTITRGRTTPAFDLALETLVSTAESAPTTALLASEEHRAVTRLCRAPRSVAEVAALLSLPLGVVRVLLADMANIGLIVVHRDVNGSGDTPDLALMERVLSGLRRL